MEIASFYDNNKEYKIILIDNNIKFGFQENDIINYNLTDEEISLMKEVFSKLLLSDNYLKLNILKYNNKLFQSFYDKDTKNKFFLQIINNKYFIPKEIDNQYLLKTYNNNIELYIGKNKNNLYQKLVSLKNNKKILVTINLAGLIVAISLGAETISNLNSLKENYVESVNISKIDKEEALEKIITTLSKNNNLTEEEKNIVKKYNTLLEENIDYIDINTVCERLKDLDIEYNSLDNANYYDDYVMRVEGKYNIPDNTIILYNSDETIEKKHILYHELSHVFSKDVTSLSHQLQEAINETMTYEYIDNYIADNTYQDERTCLYVLCEIIGSEPFRKLHFQDDLNSVINELNKIINSPIKAYTLIDKINLIQEYKLNNNVEYIALKNELYNEIKQYYEAKFNTPIEENKTMMIYLQNSGFKTDIVSEYSSSYIYSFNPKGYFSSDYIKIHPNIDSAYYEEVKIK